MKRWWVFFLITIFAMHVQAQGNPLEGIWVRGETYSFNEFAFWGASGCTLNGEEYGCLVDSGNLVENTFDGAVTTPFRIEGNVLYFDNPDTKDTVIYIRGAYSFSCPAGTVDPRLIGTWFDGVDSIQFRDDGKAIQGKDTLDYTAGGQLLVMEYTMYLVWKYAYAVHGNTLLTSNGNHVKQYQRADGKETKFFGYADGTNELIGQWVSYGEETIDEAIFNRDANPNRVFTISPWGNLKYYWPSLGESRFGTIKYDGSHIFFHMPSVGDQSSTIERMNHPVTGAPLIIISGKAFVAAGNQEPW